VVCVDKWSVLISGILMTDEVELHFRAYSMDKICRSMKSGYDFEEVPEHKYSSLTLFFLEHNTFQLYMYSEVSNTRQIREPFVQRILLLIWPLVCYTRDTTQTVYTHS